MNSISKDNFPLELGDLRGMFGPIQGVGTWSPHQIKPFQTRLQVNATARTSQSRISRLGRHAKRILAAAAVASLFMTAQAQARINLVTLPGRDTVQLTIYNSADLTLVRETRVLTFRKGINRLEFSWANTLIDPTSVEFRARTHADEVEVLDASFPPRVTNTLEWRIQSEFAGEVEVEIRYFTSGISWAADYVAEAATQEKTMNLAGRVRVTNNSGEDYENAQVRLIVGVIKLVESIAELAKRDELMGRELTEKLSLTRTAAAPAPNRVVMAAGVLQAEALADKQAEIAKEELSEYFMYTVEGRDTIPNGWSKMLPSFSAADIPVTSYYKYEREQWGDQVMRFYRFKNDKESKLGKEPLPDGEVKAFRLLNADQRHAFVGSTMVKYIPVNEQVDMELGVDQEVSVKPKIMNWEKTDIQFDSNGDVKGWTIKQTWELETQNSKEIDVVLDIRQNFQGDWSMESEAKYEKLDADKVKFVLPLKSGEKKTIQYNLTMRYGTNETK